MMIIPFISSATASLCVCIILEMEAVSNSFLTVIGTLSENENTFQSLVHSKKLQVLKQNGV